MNILDKLVKATKERVARDKALCPDFLGEAARVLEPFAFEKALKAEGLSFICEVKKASPSKGVIVKNFDPAQIAHDYQKAGAAAISVLTETDYFLGSDEYLSAVRRRVDLPLLRKDFTIDPYQIEQSYHLGADAILLIVAILSPTELKTYLEHAHGLGLSCIVEVHDEEELQAAVRAGARIVGVNNRNLKTFEVDIQNSMRLKELAPDDLIFVAESGIKTRDDIALLEQRGVDAVLIGETLMRSEDKSSALDKLRGVSHD